MLDDGLITEDRLILKEIKLLTRCNEQNFIYYTSNHINRFQ